MRLWTPSFPRKSLLCNGVQSCAFQVRIFASLSGQLVQFLFYSVVCRLGLSTDKNARKYIAKITRKINGSAVLWWRQGRRQVKQSGVDWGGHVHPTFLGGVAIIKLRISGFADYVVFVCNGPYSAGNASRVENETDSPGGSIGAECGVYDFPVVSAIFSRLTLQHFQENWQTKQWIDQYDECDEITWMV